VCTCWLPPTPEPANYRVREGARDLAKASWLGADGPPASPAELRPARRNPAGYDVDMAVTPAAEKLLPIEPKELARLCRKYGITELAVFGSVSRHEETESSDIDLLYTLTLDSELGWDIEELNQQLAEALGRPVDLVSKKYLHSMLREQVLREAVTVYAA